MRRAARVPIPESAVLKACLQLLRAHPKVGIVWRCNTGAMANPAGRWVRFGFVGQSDLLAVLKPSGRVLAVECKRKGGKATEAQEAFLRAVIASGGHALVIDDVSVLADYLRRC